MRFESCYCNSPLCVPSRLSFTAGQYLSRCDVWNNNAWLPREDYPSLMHCLNAAGYQTALCGKQHYDTTRRYGFQIDVMPETNASHKVGGPQRRDPDDASMNTSMWLGRSAKFDIADDGLVLRRDRAVTAACRGFLNARRREDPPFFLFAGYIAPHFPLTVPRAYADRFYGQTPDPIARPDFAPVDHDALPRNYRHHRLGFGNHDADPNVERRGRDHYWALTRWFDDEVNRLLSTLERSAVADNTVVIYTSDHGENKADHGLWWKNCLYDHAARVPLIVSWPERWAGGQRRSGVCSLIDLVQTLIQLGDGEPHEQMEGDSLLGVLDDPQAAWKDRAISEYYGHSVCSGIAMLREGQWKYVYHSAPDDQHPSECELFDMHADPQELTNLAHQPDQQSRLKDMHRSLVAELGEEPDTTEQLARNAPPYDR